MAVLDAVLNYEFESLYYADDWGSQNGFIMGSEIWRAFIRPCLKKIFSKAKSKGKYIIVHSCGDNRDILSDFIDIGIDCYNTVQPEIYDLAWLKREYSRDLSFLWCNQQPAVFTICSCDGGKRALPSCLNIMSGNGGYILSPTHNITPDIPIENAFAIIEAAREFGG